MFTLGVDSSVELSELKVPLTVFGAIILAFGPKVFELFSGAKKAEQQERMQTALTLSRLCTHIDTIMANIKEDKEDVKELRKEIQALDHKFSTDLSKYCYYKAVNKEQKS